MRAVVQVPPILRIVRQQHSTMLERVAFYGVRNREVAMMADEPTRKDGAGGLGDGRAWAAARVITSC